MTYEQRRGERLSSRRQAHPLLSPEEERALGERILTGDKEAMRELAQHNLRLVPGIAAQYQARYHYRGLPLPDRIQEGNLGLLRAAGKFAWRRGNHFSTYAPHWIRQTCGRASARDGCLIRIPGYLQTKAFWPQLSTMPAWWQVVSLDSLLPDPDSGTRANIVEDDSPSVEEQVEAIFDGEGARRELLVLFDRAHVGKREQLILALHYASEGSWKGGKWGRSQREG